MSPYAVGALLVGLALVQTTVMPYAALGEAKPLLPLLAVVSWGLFNGALAAAWWALGAGLALDVLSDSPIGTYAVPLVLASATVGLVRGRLHPSNLVLPIAVVAAATVAFTLAQRLLLSLRGDAVSWTASAMAEDIMPAILLNLLWLPVLYFPLRAVARASRPHMDWEA